jgi:hypothetical protein
MEGREVKIQVMTGSWKFGSYIGMEIDGKEIKLTAKEALLISAHLFEAVEEVIGFQSMKALEPEIQSHGYGPIELSIAAEVAP